jgi:hypothetical protein
MGVTPGRKSDGVVGWLTGRSAQRQFDRFVSEVTDRPVRTAYLMIADPCEAEDLE